MNDRMNAMLMFSGGYDSTSLLWNMCRNPRQYLEGAKRNLVIYPVYCSYGNVNTEKEIASASSVISYIKSTLFKDSVGVQMAELKIVSMPHLNGSITASGQDCSHDGHFAKEYVPFRNATMVLTALASCTTSDLNFDIVYMGCHASDTELKFPDCGKEFEQAMNSLLSLYHGKGVGQYPYISLPCKHLTKAELSCRYGMPRELFLKVFSGYTDGKPPTFQTSDLEKDAHVTTAPMAGSRVQVKPLSQDEAKVLADAGVILEKTFPEQPATSLMVKEHEPLIIRKFTQYGFPLYVGLICGANLDNLDSVVHGFLQPQKERIQQGGIQNMRNMVGELSAKITETYGLKIEGVAVVWYVDKMMVSSLYGDFMTHTSCRIEFYSLLQMMCHV